MFNYYLYNKSYAKANAKSIELNLQDLNDLVISERKPDDSFLKHDLIWSAPTADGVFSEVVFSQLEDKQLSHIVIPKMFQAIDSVENEINTFEEFDDAFKIYNAFYGVNFTEFELERCITDKTTYKTFREKHLWELNPNSFWERRDSLFSKIKFCNSVEDDVKMIGGAYLEQIVYKLKELDKYAVQHWNKVEFNYINAKENSSLNISPESEKTMSQKIL